MAKYRIEFLHKDQPVPDIAFCQEDVLECLHVHHSDLREAVEWSVHQSVETYVVYRDDTPCAIFGIALSCDVGKPWFVSDGKLTDVRKRFLTKAREYLYTWEAIYGLRYCEQTIWTRHEGSKRLLEFLGFTPSKVGVNTLTYTKEV